MPLHATEISFRLGPDSVDRARAWSDRLAEAAGDASEQMLFLDPDLGVFGYLALWQSPEAGQRFVDDDAVVAIRAEIEDAAERPIAVRHYLVERPG